VISEVNDYWENRFDLMGPIMIDWLHSQTQFSAALAEACSQTEQLARRNSHPGAHEHGEHKDVKPHTAVDGAGGYVDFDKEAVAHPPTYADPQHEGGVQSAMMTASAGGAG